MIVESICILIKDISIKPTNEANILHVLSNLTLLVSQLSKCINNNTKDNIDENDINQSEERHIKDHSKDKFSSICRNKRYKVHRITDTTTISQTIIYALKETLKKTFI